MTRKSKFMIIITLLALAGLTFNGCGKKDGNGVGGKVIIKGAGN